jgi:hypothetical protein
MPSTSLNSAGLYFRPAASDDLKVETICSSAPRE